MTKVKLTIQQLLKGEKRDHINPLSTVIFVITIRLIESYGSIITTNQSCLQLFQLLICKSNAA